MIERHDSDGPAEFEALLAATQRFAAVGDASKAVYCLHEAGRLFVRWSTTLAAVRALLAPAKEAIDMGRFRHAETLLANALIIARAEQETAGRRRIEPTLASKHGPGRKSARLHTGTTLLRQAAAPRDETTLDTGDRPGADPILTAREWDVVESVMVGLSNRQIARKLSVSERTVESHLANIRSKLKLRSRAQVAAWAATRVDL